MPEIEEPLRPRAVTVIGSLGTIGLIAGLAVCLAVAAGLALMIAFLRSSEVREAFHRPPESMMHNAG
jgi:Na+(H+)/acetate symporter ActP